MTPVTNIIAVSLLYERPKDSKLKDSKKKDKSEEKTKKIANQTLEHPESSDSL